MRALTSIETVWRGDFKSSPANSRLLEKTRKSGASSQDNKRPSQESPRRTPRLQVELVCQSETQTHDPFRDAPRLTPGFVTQILGQAMTPERARLVRTAYGKPGAYTAGLLDEKL
jgi:hypothetical protein